MPVRCLLGSSLAVDSTPLRMEAQAMAELGLDHPALSALRLTYHTNFAPVRPGLSHATVWKVVGAFEREYFQVAPLGWARQVAFR
jgi:hypothetical protein